MPSFSSDRAFQVRDKRPYGYFRIFNEIYENYGAKLGPYGLTVYMALCCYANRDSECWPSYQIIADKTGMSRRQVIREIQKIEELKVVEVIRRRHPANVYISLDTSDTQSPLNSDRESPLGDRQSLGSDRHAPKQNKKKITH